MSETDKLKVEMYDEVIKEKNKEYIELTCRFRETCNDIKELLKENGNKENVIKAQDNIIKEVREKIKEFCWDYEYETYSNMTSDEVKELAELLDKEVN